MPGLGLGFGAEELGREERRDERKKRLEQRHLRAGGRRRRAVEENPDSAILYSSDHHSAGHGNAGARSAGNLFSSPSGSTADRCSFGSDPDHFFSQLSALHLAGRERCGGAGPDPDPEKGASSPFPFPGSLTTQPPKGQYQLPSSTAVTIQ